MDKSIGQKQEVWTEEWKKVSIESEIQMWDFFGARPWILKYVPRYGKVIEAGCGLGRYVFLLDRLGITIEGLDFSSETIKAVNCWKMQRNFNTSFKEGNITELPYPNDSLSGYLSFGVIEHFKEGPHVPLKEAYRVLKPGGIAIFTTPSKSWFYYYYKIKSNLRIIIKKFIGKKYAKPPFFQYWYSLKQLEEFIVNEGFIIVRKGNADILYTFYEFCKLYKINILNHKWLFKVAQILEGTFIRYFGAQSIVISVKGGNKMQCFLCGNDTADFKSLKKYDIPICANHSINEILAFYNKSNKNPSFKYYYLINPKFLKPEKRICSFTKKSYTTDDIFENFGLNINIHPELLKDPYYNIKVSNQNLLPIWRDRS